MRKPSCKEMQLPLSRQSPVSPIVSGSRKVEIREKSMKVVSQQLQRGLKVVSFDSLLGIGVIY